MAFTIRPSDIIKTKAIDFLIDYFDGVIIGNEVMYGSSHKVVDLLALYNGETYAIEIKSSKDDLRRLAEQITEYSKIFDHTIVFAAREHLIKIQNLAKKNVSILEVSPDGYIVGNLLKKRNNIQKIEMLATMNSAFIRKKLSISKAKDSDAIRRRGMRQKKDIIHSLLYEYFWEKLFEPYKLFLKERGAMTEVDDITLLSNRLNIE